MLSTTANYTAENDLKTRTPVYEAVFARSGKKYSTRAIADDATAKAYMQLPRAEASQVIPNEGKSSIGSVIFILDDIGDDITNLIKGGIGGDTVTFKIGFDNIAIADFATFFTGIVSSYKMTADLTGYEITVLDPQTLSNLQVFQCAASPLVTAIDNVSTASLLVADASGYLSAGYVRLESELIQYTGRSTSVGRQPADGAFTAIAYGAGVYVGIGTDGTVATSTDGINWNPQTAVAANNWTSVCWAAGLSLFVAVASTGTNRVMTSPDGQTWTAQSVAAQSWRSVAWSASLALLAAVSSDGTNTVMTSTDGAAWTLRVTAFQPSNVIAWSADDAIFSTVTMTSVDGITWTDRTSLDGMTAVVWSSDLSLFAAVGSTAARNIMTSPDGINWTVRVRNAGINLACVAWAPALTLFVAAASNSSNYYTSADGITWTLRTTLLVTPTSIVWSVESAVFVAVANTGSVRAARSTDGLTWTTVIFPYAWSGVAWSSSLGLFAAVSPSAIYTSPDGSSWTLRVGSGNAIMWVASLSKFVVVTNNGTSGAYTSTDGITWTARTTPNQNWLALDWSPSLILFAALAADSSTNQIMTSADGVTWAAQTVPATITTAYSFVSKCISWSAGLAIFSTLNMTSADGVTWRDVGDVMDDINDVMWVADLSLFIGVGGSSSRKPVVTSPDGITWTRRGTITSSAWGHVAWSSSLTLAVATTAGNVYTSPDGITWTGRSIGFGSESWGDIAWSSSLGKFCVVNQSAGSSINAVYTSTNGTSWTGRTTHRAGTFRLTWSSTLAVFCIVDASVGAFTELSADGVTWTEYASAGAQAWTSVCWAASLNLFVAVSSAGTNRVMTSPDGQTWTFQSASEANKWQRVIFADSLGLLIAVASDGTHQVMTSTNGTAWTNQTQPANSFGYVGVCWSPDKTLAVAVFGGLLVTGRSQTYNRPITSANGTAWSATTVAEPNASWQSVAWSATLAIFAAVSSGGTNRVSTSADGVTWIARTAAEANTWKSVIWVDGAINLFVAVATTGTNRVMTSTDGSTWTARSAATANQWNTLVWSSDLSIFIALSSDASGTTNAMKSTNGTAWTSIADVDANSWGGVTWSAGLSLFVAVASSGTSRVSVSADGKSWTPRTAAEANNWTSVAWSSSLALLVAVASSGTNRVMTSADGTTWTARSAAEANPWTSVIWVSGISKLVAVATSGTHQVMTSADGTTWATQTQAGAGAWKSLAYASSLGRVLSISGTSSSYRPMYSADAITWTAVLAADVNTWNGLTWASGLTKFVAVSSDGTNRVSTSADGITWTPRSAAQANSWRNVSWAASLTLLAAVSSDGTNRVMTSPDGITWTVRTAGAANAWQAVIFANSLFVALANSGVGNRAMSSTDGITWTVYNSLLTGITRAVLGTTAAAHSVGVSVGEMLRIGPAHPIDIYQNTLLNTDKTGLSIPSALIDSTTLAAVKAAIGASYTMEFRIFAAVNAKTWLESQICQPTACYPVMTGGGKYSIAHFATPVTAVKAFTHDNINNAGNAVAIGWDGNYSTLINSVQVLYDLNPITNVYGSALEIHDNTSIALYGQVPLVLTSDGYRSSAGGTVTLITAVINAILNRYKNGGAPVITIEAFLQTNLVEAGDIASITSAVLPNRSTGARGVTALLCEVISREVDFATGFAKFELLQTSG